MPAFTNAKQRIPPVFEEIAKNYEARKKLKAEPVVPFSDYKSLRQDMDRNLRPGAERILRSGKKNG